MNWSPTVAVFTWFFNLDVVCKHWGSYPKQNYLPKEQTVGDEMMIYMNGPEIGESDNILKLAQNQHFDGKS